MVSACFINSVLFLQQIMKHAQALRNSEKLEDVMNQNPHIRGTYVFEKINSRARMSVSGEDGPSKCHQLKGAIFCFLEKVSIEFCWLN